MSDTYPQGTIAEYKQFTRAIFFKKSFLLFQRQLLTFVQDC